MVSRIGIALGLSIVIILSACNSAAPVSPSPHAVLQTASASRPLALGVPVLEYHGQANELTIISSISGRTFDSVTPIVVGNNYNSAFEPDGKTLAVVSEGQLYLIDLQSWKYQTSDIATGDVGMYGSLSSVVYSPDGTRLALASSLSDGDLRIVDTQSGKVIAGTEAGFAVRQVKFTADGKSIMVFGPHLAAGGDAANAGVGVGDPEAAFYDVSSLSLLWSVELNGVRDGTFPKNPDTANTEAIYQPGAAWHFEPGVAFDPTLDVVYVVHGDEDKLTVVDFAHRKTNTVAVQARTSWLAQLMAWSAGVALAKGMDGTTKQTVISPDGKFLYVVGSKETVTQQANSGNWDITDTPIGLQVISTQDGALIDQVETEASSAMVSPDGRQILLTGWSRTDSSETPWLEVYDALTMRIIKHLDGVDLTPTRRLDGTPILISDEYLSDNSCDTTLIDPTTWTIASEWNDQGCVVGWLMDAGPWNPPR